jgi:hypothetical protein
MEDRVAEALSKMGNGSISAGFEWLFNKHMSEHPEGEMGLIAQAHADHRSALSAQADAVAATERERAAKKAAKGPSKAKVAFDETVKHFVDMNAQRLVEGNKHGLFQMSHLAATQPNMVAVVYAHNRDTYGWEFGPRPPGLPPSRLTREAAQTMAAVRGYCSQWVDVVAPADTVNASSDPPPASAAPPREPLTSTEPLFREVDSTGTQSSAVESGQPQSQDALEEPQF